MPKEKKRRKKKTQKSSGLLAFRLGLSVYVIIITLVTLLNPTTIYDKLTSQHQTQTNIFQKLRTYIWFQHTKKISP